MASERQKNYIYNISSTCQPTCYTQIKGRVIAEAVSLRHPTAVTRVRTQVRSCGIRGGQNGTAAGFLRVLRFPLPVPIPPTAPHLPTIRDWYKTPTVADVPSGLSLTPPKETGKSSVQINFTSLFHRSQ
jgi:hypothetical protein